MCKAVSNGFYGDLQITDWLFSTDRSGDFLALVPCTYWLHVQVLDLFGAWEKFRQIFTLKNLLISIMLSV